MHCAFARQKITQNFVFNFIYMFVYGKTSILLTICLNFKQLSLLGDDVLEFRSSQAVAVNVVIITFELLTSSKNTTQIF